MTATSNPQPRPARSRTRIGADEARAWARKLRLHNPYAKSILNVVANYMNEDGAAWPGIETLHLDTDIAEETIISRLRWCESIGAIALFKRWVDENGRRNGDGRGRVTSTEIRFLFDADLDEIEANALGTMKPRPLRGAARASHEGKAISPRPDGEQTEEPSPRPDGEQTEAGPRLAPEQPPPPATRTEELESKEDSPLPPKGGEPQQSIDQQSEAKESPKVASWQRFERAWSEPILRQSIARQVWSALTESEEEIAIRAAKGYVVHRRSQKKPPNVINAHTFLRERDAWVGFAALAPSEPPKPKPVTFLPVDSDEFAALALSFAIARRLLRPLDGGAKFSGDAPAGAAGLAALVRFNTETFEVDQSDWTLAAQGSRRYVAWSERIKEWLGSWPEVHRYWLDRAGNIVPTVEQAEGYGDRTRLPKACDGLLLPPLEFPPPKGTGHSITGPPLSDEDAQILIHESSK